MKKSIVSIFLLLQVLITFGQDFESIENDFIEKYEGTYVDITGKSNSQIILKYAYKDFCFLYSDSLYLPSKNNIILIHTLLNSTPNTPAFYGGADKGGGGISTSIYFFDGKLVSYFSSTNSYYNTELNLFDETITKSKITVYKRISKSTAKNGIDIRLTNNDEYVINENLRLRNNEQKNGDIITLRFEISNIDSIFIAFWRKKYELKHKIYLTSDTKCCTISRGFIRYVVAC